MDTNIQKRFCRVYRDREWGLEHRAGKGSTDANTKAMALNLKSFLHQRKIKTLLDVGCGLCSWIARALGEDFTYIGIDVVPSIIQENADLHPEYTFAVSDVSSDILPKADIALVRDVFTHLPNKTVWESLENLRGYVPLVLATTFPCVTRNRDVQTGGWRPLNLAAFPFFLRPAEALVEETFGQGKTLGLWNLK